MNSLGIVVNNKAKNVDALPDYLDALSANGIAYSLYKSKPEELDEILKDCVKKHDFLLVGGGDGTIRSAAQYCVNTSVLLGVLPLGTLNHFAKELGLPESSEELIQAIRDKQTIKIDAAEVNGQVFVNNSSLGFYPKFAKKLEKYKKFYNKWLSYIPGVLDALKSHDSYSVTIKSQGLNCSYDTSFLMLSNNLYSYQFPMAIEREHFDRSQLGIYVYKHGKLSLTKLTHYFYHQKRSFEMMKSTFPVKVEIINKKKILLSLDGETMMIETPLHYKMLPKALTVLTSKP